jgi:hypothetical protein
MAHPKRPARLRFEPTPVRPESGSPAALPERSVKNVRTIESADFDSGPVDVDDCSVEAQARGEHALLKHRLELLGGFSQPAIGFLQLKAHRLDFAVECLIGGSAHAPPNDRTNWKHILRFPSREQSRGQMLKGGKGSKVAVASSPHVRGAEGPGAACRYERFMVCSCARFGHLLPRAVQ